MPRDTAEREGQYSAFVTCGEHGAPGPCCPGFHKYSANERDVTISSQAFSGPLREWVLVERRQQGLFLAPSGVIFWGQCRRMGRVKLRMELDPGPGKKVPRHVRAPSLMAQSRQSLCFPDCGQEQPLQVHRWIGRDQGQLDEVSPSPAGSRGPRQPLE